MKKQLIKRAGKMPVRKLTKRERKKTACDEADEKRRGNSL